MKGIRIAIDGPAGAGKSTAARLLAERLGYKYIDSGAMYRAVTLLALRFDVGWEDEKKLAMLIDKHNICQNGLITTIDGEDVSLAIRSKQVSEAVSVVCKHPLVRKKLVEMQRNLAKDGAVVMEGRDIGTVVLPDAELKFFIIADQEERARRRLKEMVALGKNVTFTEVLENIKLRDLLDSSRAVAPLRQASDAILVDNTRMSIDFEIDIMEKIARRKLEDKVEF
ncbi:MAG: (d)CMP kinase [Deltaproteobacteria bacterium]|nr:MAG: (d)CMP kinase [Deltaproteobacteria bacterium]